MNALPYGLALALEVLASCSGVWANDDAPAASSAAACRARGQAGATSHSRALILVADRRKGEMRLGPSFETATRLQAMGRRWDGANCPFMPHAVQCADCLTSTSAMGSQPRVLRRGTVHSRRPCCTSACRSQCASIALQHGGNAVDSLRSLCIKPSAPLIQGPRRVPERIKRTTRPLRRDVVRT